MVNGVMSIMAVREAFHRAEEQFERGDYEQAFQAYCDLLVTRIRAGVGSQSPVTALDVIAMERLAGLAVLYGFYTPAVDLLQAVHSWFGSSSNVYSADFTALKLASIYIAQGLIRHAYEILLNLKGVPDNLENLEFTDSALMLWESGHSWTASTAEVSLIFSRLYLEIAHILAANGQYRSARAAAERGLQHVDISQLESSFQAKPSLHLLIVAAKLESGDLAGAQIELDRLDPCLHSPISPAIIVRRDELLGKLKLLRGELGLAKESFERVIKTCQQGSFDSAELNASLNLANVLIILNQTHRANQLIQRVKAAAVTDSLARLQVRAKLLENLALGRARSFIEGVSIAPSVFRMWGGIASLPNPPAEETNFLKIPSDVPDCESYLALFEDRALGFHFHLGRSDWAAAETYLDELMAAFGKTDSTLIHTLLNALQSTLLYYQGEIDKAYAGFSRVRDSLVDMEATGLLWQVYRFLSWCEARAGHEESAARIRTKGDDLLTRLTSTLPPAERAIYELNKWTAEEEFLAGEFDRLAAVQRQVSGAWIFRRMALKWRITRCLLSLLGYIDRYQSEIGERVSGARSAAFRNRLAVFLWICAQGWRRATIRFVVLPDRVIVIHFRTIFIDFSVAALSRIQLRDAVREWHEAVLDEATGLRKLETLEHLVSVLELPVMLNKLPARIRHICFMPDDVLNGLPFAALRHEGKYLIERFSISLEYAMSQNRAPALKQGEALITAVLKGTDQYPALEGAEDEAAMVSSYFSKYGVVPHTVFDPASDSLIRMIAESRFFHIVCHGTFRVDAPDQSGFVLVHCGQAQVLTLRQLHALDLGRVEMAVLASCWSADNFLLPGRWVISLPLTFRSAGANSVIASLWEVDNRLAPKFLARFYERLSSASRAEALRQTQLDCLHGRLMNFDVSSPIYWAGYSLYGATGRVSLRRIRESK